MDRFEDEAVRPPLRRLSFLAVVASVLILTAVIAMPSEAQTTSRQVERIAEAIPGHVAVFARELSGAARTVSVDAGEPFPAASIIKLAVMVAAYRAIDAGRISPATPIVFSAADIVAGSESFGSMRAGGSAPLGALLLAMIRQSDNSAANALIERFGFAAVNAVSAQAGLPNTRLRRYFMYFSKTHENVTSARDVGTLLGEIARGARGERVTLASVRSCRAMVNTLLGQEDREKIAAALPRGIPLANKTGELPGVRGDAGIVDPYGPRPYVLVVLEKDLGDQTRGVAGIRRIARTVDQSFRLGITSAERR